MHAAMEGHEGVVKILLKREEVNPGKPDNGCETQLSHAALTGRGGENTTRTGRAQSRHSR